MSEAQSMPLLVFWWTISKRRKPPGGREETIGKPFFSFPGGRHFHFLDPNWPELAIMQTD